MKKTGWIILGVVVLLVLWGLSSYNGIIGVQEQATTELANVQTQYQRRADMMPQLVKIVKAYAKHEKETFEAVTKARAAVGQVKLDANNLTPEKLKAYSDAQYVRCLLPSSQIYSVFRLCLSLRLLLVQKRLPTWIFKNEINCNS